MAGFRPRRRFPDDRIPSSRRTRMSIGWTARKAAGNSLARP
jgi:hypothetical protein